MFGGKLTVRGSTMLGVTIQLAGRRVHLVRDVRDCDVCRNHARHARVDGRSYVQSEINRAVQGDASALADFRNLAQTYGLLHDVHRVIDSRILEHVAWLLETERLLAIECVEVREHRPSAPPIVRPAPPRPRPRPVALEDLKTWIEIELLDNEDKPVPNERYLIKVPGGTTETGTLDANGRARITGLDPGMCDISFPDIDLREWRPA
jgi:hypothetical protein